MRKIISISIISLVTLLSSCENKQKNELNSSRLETIRVIYDQKINGYDVVAIWKPLQELEGMLIGSAIITFTKDAEVFSITDDFFVLPVQDLKVKIDSNGKVETIETQEISSKYVDFSFEDSTAYELIESPFFFSDINFDGEDELFLVQYGQGNRGFQSIKGFEKGINFGYKPLYWGNDGINPYLNLDTNTNLDKNKKELTISGSGGVCFNYVHTFKPGGPYGLELTNSIEQDRGEDLDDCYQLEYNYPNGVKTLVSKKKYQKEETEE